MTYSVVFTQHALADLRLAADYIEYDLCNVTASHKLVQNFFAQGDSLEIFPGMGSLCNDEYLQSLEIRFVPVNNYLLFYIVREGARTVYVLRFLYSRRNWQNILCKQLEDEVFDLTTHYIQEETEKYGAK